MNEVRINETDGKLDVFSSNCKETASAIETCICKEPVSDF